MYDDNNIFAKILRNELTCQKVYEDDHCLAFHDIHPQAPVHVVVIPKKPYLSFVDFSQQASIPEIANFFKTIGHISQQLHLDVSGYRLITNHGPDSGQEVAHFHVHLLGWKV